MGFLMHPNDTLYPPGAPPGPRAQYLLVGPPAHCAAPNCGLPVHLSSYILPVWGKVLRLFTLVKAAVRHQLSPHAYDVEPLPKS